LGAYKLYSRKDADAYPDRSDIFYADSKAEVPKVDLTEDHPSATVRVTLGEKAGVLGGRVIDADTGAAVKAKLVFMTKMEMIIPFWSRASTVHSYLLERM